MTRPAYIALQDTFRIEASHLKRASEFSLFDMCFDLSGLAKVKVSTPIHWACGLARAAPPPQPRVWILPLPGSVTFQSGSAVHLMNTMIMTLVLKALFDPTVRLVMMYFYWWVLLKRVVVASIPALRREGAEGNDELIQTCQSINRTWSLVTHQGFLAFSCSVPFFSDPSQLDGHISWTKTPSIDSGHNRKKI